MPYCTQSQLVERFGEAMLVALTDRADVPTGAVSAAVVTRGIAEADAMIDGYLGGRYALPLAATPALIANLSQVITLWILHLSEPEAKVKADHDAAMRSLRDIAQGVIRIPDAAGIEPVSSGASGVQIVDRERPFTEGNMKGFI